MAVRGVPQLTRLTVSLCERSGSSRGAREFVEKLLPGFQADFPQVEVARQLRPGRHPFLAGEFVNGKEWVIGVKNQSSAQVHAAAVHLQGSLGQKRVGNRTKAKHRSLQGTWASHALRPGGEQVA